MFAISSVSIFILYLLVKLQWSWWHSTSKSRNS